MIRAARNQFKNESPAIGASKRLGKSKQSLAPHIFKRPQLEPRSGFSRQILIDEAALTRFREFHYAQEVSAGLPSGSCGVKRSRVTPNQKLPVLVPTHRFVQIGNHL